MDILGIHDGTHDASAALLRDGALYFTAAEEHYTRVKGAGGWPGAAVAACLQQAGHLDAVAFPGLVNPNPGLRFFRGIQKRFLLDGSAFWSNTETPSQHFSQWLQFQSPFPKFRAEHRLAPALKRLLLPKLRHDLGLHNTPVFLFDHHQCHAASAYFSQSEADLLVLVVDGIGDGLALSVYQGSRAGLTRLDAWPYPHSYGLFYACITGFLGFKPFRHEGKLTGLAAHGNADAIDLPFPFTGPPEARRFQLRFGRNLREWLRPLQSARREDVCAWLQRGIEEDLSALLCYWCRKTGLRNVGVAGGVVANVRLNQKLSKEVDSLWVFPHMGDGGLAAGAAWLAQEKLRPQSARALDGLFLGYQPEEYPVEILKQEGFRVEAAMVEAVAAQLAAGRVVARYAGAQEFGPRALGNRSILAPCNDASVPTRLNKSLDRSDFMPFAPVLLGEDAEEWVDGLPPLRQSTRYMTTTVDAKYRLQQLCPAVVHADGSLRPQLVFPGDPLYDLLAAYRRRTGVPALLNTSFNLHEEPIVCSPQQAIATWKRANLDVLWLGPHLVYR